MHWLSEQDLQKLTRRQKPSAQMRVLRDAGIPFRVVDARPVVLMSDLGEAPKRKPKLRAV
jgi:hypothetical protein